jgi:hypothetical protein
VLLGHLVNCALVVGAHCGQLVFEPVLLFL